MRFLVFSDVHFNLWKLGSPTKRLIDQIYLLNNIKEHALQNNIKYILFSGDLFHTHGNLRTEVVNAVYTSLTSFKKAGIELIGISGNHDHADKQGLISSLEIFPFVKLDNSILGERRDLPTIKGITYTENSERLTAELKTVPHDSLILMHQGVSGIPINVKGFTLNEIMSADMVPNKAMIAFCGHYHSFKKIGKLIIPGALCQHNFGDVDDVRGFLDVCNSNGKWQIEYIDSPELFKTVKYRDEFCLDEDLKKFNSVPFMSKFVRITGVPFSKQSSLKEQLYNYKHKGPHFNVDFQIIYENEETNIIEKVETPKLDNVVSQFIDAQPNLSERRKQVGLDIIKGTYEIS